MLERLAGKILQRFLAKYFDVENNETLTMGVWSGLVSLQDLHVNIDQINPLLAQKGIPVRIQQLHISRLEITIPWSQLSFSSGTMRSSGQRNEAAEVVVLIDGVHCLAKSFFDFDDMAIAADRIAQRQKILKAGLQRDTDKSTFAETLKRRLREGLLQQLAESLQVHIRNVHIRYEDSNHAFSCGMVCESLHLQQDVKPPSEEAIRKVVQVNHVGIYWNPVEKPRNGLPVEQTFLGHLPTDQICRALDRSVARRMPTLQASNPLNAPKHTYLIVPIDASVHLSFSTDPRDFETRPALEVIIEVPELTLGLRDFQIYQIIRLIHDLKEHNYRKKHYRRFRPSSPVTEDPKAWWQYAVAVVRYEIRENRLRWSWGRFRRRFEQRKRYCYLYERMLRVEIAMPYTPIERSSLATELSLAPLSATESQELEDLDNGVLGDLDVHDILLFRLLVSKRMGLKNSGQATNGRTNWFRRTMSTLVSGDDEAEEEYERLLSYWQQRSTSEKNWSDASSGKFCVALSSEIRIENGRTLLYSPVSSTIDLEPLRRIQECFLEISFTVLEGRLSLLQDFETIISNMSLLDFIVSEVSSTRRENILVKRIHKPGIGLFDSKRLDGSVGPVFSLVVRKNAEDSDESHIEVQARIECTEAHFSPEDIWLPCFKRLMQPVPQLQQMATFWSELSMANINSWASDRLSLVAKARTAVNQHRNIDINLEIECPIIRVSDGKGCELVFDLGQAYVRTERLASFGSSNLSTFAEMDDRMLSKDRRFSYQQRNPLISRDVASFKTPPRLSTAAIELPTSPTRTDYVRLGFTENMDRADDNLNLINPTRLPFSTKVTSIASADSDRSYRHQYRGQMEAIFYDVFEMRLVTGTVVLGGASRDVHRICHPVDMRAAIHKSIIPADHTLCRLKLFCDMEDISVDLSEPIVFALGRFFNVWKLVLSTKVSKTLLMTSNLGVESILPNLLSEVDVSDDDFDENGFFDALESESFNSPDADALFKEHWVSETTNLLDEGVKSVTKSVRSRRRRPRSVSDVSSLSESSLARRRLTNQGNGNIYLSAENLAMLEEADESGGLDEEEDDYSFHSAYSLSHLLTLSENVQTDIIQAVSNVHRLKDKIYGTGVSSSVGSFVSVDEVKRSLTMRKALRLELGRATAELQALRDAHKDLLYQIKISSSDENEGTPLKSNRSGRVSRSIEVASALLQTRKQPTFADTDANLEHTLVRGLNRDLLQIWLTLRCVSIRFVVNSGTDGSLESSNTFAVKIANSNLVRRQSAIASRYSFSLDNVSAIHENDVDPALDRCFIVGGSSSETSSKLLPSLFPQFISSLSMENKFLSGAVCLQRKRQVMSGKSSKMDKIRIAFGDIELKGHTNSLRLIQQQMSSLSSVFRVTNTEVYRKMPKTQERMLDGYFDVGLRISSLRLVFEDEEGHFAAATALTEVDINFSGASFGRQFQDRSQLDIRLGNFQVLSIEDLDSGVGNELVAKQDLYNPLLRLRLRQQIVPRGEQGGWVVGQSSTMALHSSLDEINIHLGLRMDSMESHLSFSTLFRLSKSISFATKAFGKCPIVGRPSLHTVDSGDSSLLSSVPVRWRVDVSMKKFLMTLESSGAFLETGRENQMVLMATAKLNCSLQPSTTKCREGKFGVEVKFTIADFSISVVTEELPVLEPISIHIDLVAFPKAMQFAPFTLPKDSPWSDQTTLSTPTGRITWKVDYFQDKLPISIAVALSSTRINISPSRLGLLHSALEDLARCSATIRRSQQLVSRPGSEDQIGRLYLDLTCETLIISLYPETRLLSSHADSRILALSLDYLCASWQKRGKAKRFACGLKTLCIDDMSSPPGMRALYGSRAERQLKSRIESTINHFPSFFMMRIENSEADGKKYFEIDFSIGTVHLLFLPSLVQAIKSFVISIPSLSEGKLRSPESSSSRHGLRSLSTAVGIYSVTVVSDIFECFLSSQDILKAIRETPRTSIGVVVLRQRADIELQLEIVSSDHLVERFLDEIELKQRVEGFLTAGKSSTKQVSSVVTANLEAKVHQFQVLRTTIKSIDKGEETDVLHFSVTPPQWGEQRISNEFSFRLLHQLTGAWSRAGRLSVQTFSFSNAFEMKFEFVDILLYIAQSSGGMTDAFQFTVWPIIEALSKNSGPKRLSEENSNDSGCNAIVDALLKGLSVASIRGEGIQLTCVPGGATRLTESPIIKLEVMRVAFGCAGVSSATELVNLPVSGTFQDVEQTDKIGQNFVFGAWSMFEVSAHYHNRRLVAWEPFIEPWKVSIFGGMDLCCPTTLLPSKHAATASDYTTEDGFVTSFYSPGGGRLQEIGRLLRSPFRGGISASGQGVTNSSEMLQSDIDFCYLLLLHSSESSVQGAYLPTNELHCTDARKCLPSDQPRKWVSHFGYPQDKISQAKKIKKHASITLLGSDITPLNINITGALIENVWDYIRKDQVDASRGVAPHWVRNESGLTIRFHEVLDPERVFRGEKAPKCILPDGSEAPLSLKRTRSQSCDPHRAFIFLELGCDEDVCGREHQKTSHTSGVSKTSSFYFKSTTKIPVDTVGLNKYHLDRRIESREADGRLDRSRPLGCVIVRVALQGGVKVVSVESPLVVKNLSITDIICEARDRDSSTLLWRSLVPGLQSKIFGSAAGRTVPVPVDLVPYVHESSCCFSVLSVSGCLESDLSTVPSSRPYEGLMRLPKPYTRSSLEKGVVDEIHLRVASLMLPSKVFNDVPQYLNGCSLRIGSISLSATAYQRRKTVMDVPEQRMVLIRPEVVFRNHLPVPICVQARPRPQSLEEGPPASNLWVDLGILKCGEFAGWTGVGPYDFFDIRILIIEKDGGPSKQFPQWSHSVLVFSAVPEQSSGTNRVGKQIKAMYKLRLEDSVGTPLTLSVHSSQGDNKLVPLNESNVRPLSERLQPGNRVLSIFAPYWIVDSSGLDLEFKLTKPIAGQIGPSGSLSCMENDSFSTHGLGELLDDSDLMYLPSRGLFEILMAGEEESRQMNVRRRASRATGFNPNTAPWSDTISLSRRFGSYHDTYVQPARRSSVHDHSNTDHDSFEPFALRSRLVRAPESLGGLLGTKIMHFFCRYSILNELGRDIEIKTCGLSRGAPCVVKSDCWQKPFHIEDSRFVSFRPKEYGWEWSGRFHVTSKRRVEMTFHLRHTIRDESIGVTVECVSREASGTCTVIFRPALHLPCRIENKSMFPIKIFQNPSIMCVCGFGREGSKDTVILPFHSLEFAWDEPESRRKSVLVKAVNFSANRGDGNARNLGIFALDSLTPGTVRKLEHNLSAQVLADGPTKVLRIVETSDDGGPIHGECEDDQLPSYQRPSASFPYSITVKLAHGIGLSVVDWSPQELIYLKLEDILFEQARNSLAENTDVSVGSVVVDNCLWVSPYPVAVRLGSRSPKRRHRRHNGIAISWSRPLVQRAAFGDLTMIERIEISTEPSIISVDGKLAEFAIAMTRQVKKMGYNLNDLDRIVVSRNSELRKLLKIALSVDGNASAIATDKSHESRLSDDLYAAVDCMATPAIASKLRSRFRPLTAKGVISKRMESALSPAPPQHKYYIEKLRISATAAEVSWSGSLPVAFSLPRWMRPALTFEGFPLFLRPYSVSHSYGTAEEHLRALKSHYISIWRVFDLVVGLAKPTFLIRAWYFTTRDILATALMSLSNGVHNVGAKLFPLSSAEHNVTDATTQESWLRHPYWGLHSWRHPIVQRMFYVCAGGMATSAAWLRYNAARHVGGLVRARNPRLFASTGDGNDLLVEYVEKGENAGKALLSRVRMGSHLGEGYVYHVEDAHRQGLSKNTEMGHATMILMLTFDRIVLLNGELDSNFCQVVWEVLFSDLVHLQLVMVAIPANGNDIDSTSSRYQAICLWYLANKPRQSPKLDEQLQAFAGLDAMECHLVFVPRRDVGMLLGKVRLVKAHVLD
jgi:hypothetical protein